MSLFEMDSTSTVRQQIDHLDHSECDPSSVLDEDDRGIDAGDLRTNGTRASSPVASSPVDRSARSILSRVYDPIREPIAEVERRLGIELQSPYESLMPVLRHGTQLGGKRLRPAMLLLAGAAVGELTDSHVVLGTVIELVHTATLVHDDVLDDAQTRRHVATINSRWNEHTSILLGDYLFAQSFRLAATLPSTEACRWIGEAARLVCEGELRQVLQRDVIELDEETYFDIIRGKTAELCRVACQLGAKYSFGDDALVSALGVYGNAVGIAFQIADDYLDLWGEDDTVGKTLGTDIGQGKMTLPIIRVMATASAADRARIVCILKGPAEDRLDRMRPYLDQSDARQYTRSVAERFKNQATAALAVLDNTGAKESLLAIADFSVDRRF
jgi:octaprenyl-diphosphate synthase